MRQFRAKLRPLLEVASLTDEQLMEKVNRIMSAEVERQNKMGVADRKGVGVSQVETVSPPSNQLSQPSSSQTPQNESSKTQKKEPKPNTLETALEAVQSNLASLKEAFDRVSVPVERHSTRRYASGNQSQFRRRQCNSCRTAGVDNCGHCFKCGSTDHFARRCRQASGNGQRLPSTGQGVAGADSSISSLEERRCREEREMQVSLLATCHHRIMRR